MGETKATHTKPWLMPVFIGLLTAAGVLLSIHPVMAYVSSFMQSGEKFQEIIEIAVLVIIMSLCRSLPVPTRKGEGYDISSVAIFASFLSKGAGATIVVLVVSSFFTFDKRENGKLTHIFNTSVTKTLFNNFILIISSTLSSYAFELAGGVLTGMPMPYYNLGLPGVLLPSLVYLVVLLIVDSIIMVLLFMILRGTPFLRTLVGALRTMAPTLLALSPIGYFIAFIFCLNVTAGPYMALLFFVPLLFARYAFKLYLDSRELYLRTISTLTNAIEAKDEYTEGHSKRVAQYAVEIAQAMGLRNARIENIKVAAVLHDIGKIGIDDEILRKPTKLNDYEWSKIEQHPTIGIKILEEVKMPDTVKEMIHYHHIRYDRKGYPSVSPDTQIPLEVFIISLADAFDAMTSDRPYRKAMSEEIALRNIEQERGTQFHPDIVDVFLKMKNGIQAGETK